MSVNELAKRLDDGMWSAGDPADSAIDACKQEIAAIAREAWKPVSEPPTEADGDQGGRVIVRLNTEHEYNIEIIYYADVSPSMRRWEWARIRDVVLMPPQGGE